MDSYDYVIQSRVIDDQQRNRNSLTWKIGKRLVYFFAFSSTFAVLSLTMLPVSFGLAWFFKPSEFQSTQSISLDYREFHPSGTACFIESRPASKFLANKAIPKRAIQKGHDYQAILTLSLPESEHNIELGMFQVSSEAVSTSGEVLLKETVPCILKFRNPLVRFARTFVLAIPLMWGLMYEHQNLVLPLFQSREIDPPFACIRVILEPSAGHPSGHGLPETYAASITVKSNLSLLYNWTYFLFLTAIIWGVLSFFCFIFSYILVFVGNALLSLLFSMKKQNTTPEERFILNRPRMEADEKGEEEEGRMQNNANVRTSQNDFADVDSDDDAEVMSLLQNDSNRRPFYSDILDHDHDQENESKEERSNDDFSQAKSSFVSDENEHNMQASSSAESEILPHADDYSEKKDELESNDPFELDISLKDEGELTKAFMSSILKGKRVYGHSKSTLKYMTPGAAEVESESESDTNSVARDSSEEESKLWKKIRLFEIKEEEESEEGNGENSASEKGKGGKSEKSNLFSKHFVSDSSDFLVKDTFFDTSSRLNMDASETEENETSKTNRLLRRRRLPSEAEKP